MINITDLRPYTSYTLCFSTKDMTRSSESFEVSTDEDVPEGFEANNIEIVERGFSFINITWSPPTNPNGRLLFAIIQYEVSDNNKRAVGNGIVYKNISDTGGSGSYNITGLNIASKYEITVRLNNR